FNTLKHATVLNRIFTSAFIILLSTALQSQTLTFKDIPVANQTGILYPSGLAGGMRAPQFSSIDMDGDGTEDLFVFDRNGDVKSVFLNKGGDGEIKYEYSYSHSQLFPDLKVWMILRDFNGDGLKDIFASSV